jgi:hypothetical protein
MPGPRFLPLTRKLIALSRSMRATRFMDLSDRIDELHFRFIPPLHATGVYSDADYDSMRAFRLLAHAEIESYLELLVEDALLRMTSTILAWKTAGKSSQLIDNISIYTEKEIRQSVKKNNGVKSDNILHLLRPLGINGDQLDNMWLQAMNTYGEVRGGYAHNTTRHATQLLDPATEQALVYKQLLPELGKLESLVLALI